MNALYQTTSGTLVEQLETDNLLLRPYQDGDEEDFMRLLQENAAILNPAFVGRLARVRVLEDARIQVKQLRTAWDNRKMFDFGVWIKDSKKYIGDIALKNLDHHIPKAELGLYFTNWPDTERYAQESLQAILSFGFTTLEFNKLYLRCTVANDFIGEVAESCGFLKEGVLRSDFKGVDSDELLDLNYYGMTRKDYHALLQQKEEKESTLA